MGRGKLKLELIPNEKARKATFQKRKNGIMKKAYEFSVLCDIDICLFISGPKKDRVIMAQTQSSEEENRIETYPLENDNVLRIIQKYQKTVMQKPPNKSYNLLSLLAERNKKVHADISRCRKKYYGFKYPTSAELVDGFSTDELVELIGRLDGKIEIVKQIIVDKKKENQLKMIKSKNVFTNSHGHDQELGCLNNFSTNNSMVDMNTMPPLLQIDSSFSVLNPNSMMAMLLYGDDHNESTNTSNFDYQFFNNGTSSNNMLYGNNMTTFQGPIYDDPTAGGVSLENMMMFDGTSNNNMMQYNTINTAFRGPVYNDQTAEMPLEKYMMMFDGSGTAGAASSSMQTQDHQYHYPPLVQPMLPMSYMQQMQCPVNAGPRLGSFQVTSSASRGNELTDVVNDFLKN